MKLTVLTENTTVNSELQTEHGLSLYIESCEHKILFDMGQSSLFDQNAQNMGIDLTQADLAVLSHGHYDHGGGLEHFLKINPTASVYVNEHAFGSYHNISDKYIGLNSALAESDRIVMVSDYLKIADGLELFSCNERIRPWKTLPFGLQKLENDHLVLDDFLHEQYLLIEEDGKRILISGCSHKGIFNIADWFKPDILIGGFHFMKLDLSVDADVRFLEKAAEILLRYDTTYYTCHCTGEAQYAFLKEKMGDRLQYAATGSKILV